MKRFSYSERDYAFGQAMLTLRTNIGLTQAGLAELLGVSRRAVGKWEAGGAYPKAEHLKALLAFAVKQQAFDAGHEEEEIRAFWKAAHQKVLLDKSWLSTLLSQQHRPLERVVPPSIDVTGDATPALAAPASGPRVEWGDALDVPTFYGREGELATITQWAVGARCRVVSVLGMGGIGKSALVTSAMRRMAGHFQVVIFRSLRDAPACEMLVEDCLKVLTPQPLNLAPTDLEHRLSLLLHHLRAQRVLLVLDNLESLLSEGEVQGHLRPGYEGYARLLHSVAQTAHQSCLLLTSREKPAALRALESGRSPVRSLRLVELEAAACEQILAEHELAGSQDARTRLIEMYVGNPLALKIVAEIIADLFGGEIGPFLAQGTVVFGSIADLLDEQFARLSDRERTLLVWLAIAREPVSLEELRILLIESLPMGQVLEAVDGLRRRSLVERGQRPGSFTLHSVVLEYLSAYLVAWASDEIEQGQLSCLLQYGFCQAQAGEDVRQTQERLLVAPLLARLQSASRGYTDVEKRLRFLLDQLRAWSEDAQGYGPANLLTLLRVLRGDLRGLDLSRLVLRGVYLQGVEMQDANLSGALIRDSVFTETFAAVLAVAVSPDGQYWAASGKQGEVRVWEARGQTLHRVWQAHVGMIWSLAFDPVGRTLATGSPDGRFLASSAWDDVISLWNSNTGACVERQQDPDDPNSFFSGAAWSPDGQCLASGTYLHGVLVWEMAARRRRWIGRQLQAWIRHVSWSPDGTRLAGGGDDGHVYVWDAKGGKLLQRMQGHHGGVTSVAWNSDGTRLASGSSGRDSGELFVWEVQSGERVRAFEGLPGVVFAVTWGPRGDLLVSGGSDGVLRWWEVHSAECVRVREAHQGTVQALKLSPDGSTLASCGDDGAITLWNLENGEHVRTLRRDRPYERLAITGVKGLSEAQKATLRALGAREDAPEKNIQQVPSDRQIFFDHGSTP